MIKAIIIEDEQYIAKELKDAIALIDPQIRVVEILSSLKTAKKWFLQNEEPDMIIMDIQLCDGNSFEIFSHYGLSCPVIFTADHADYALKAFRSNGVDYLLKPIDKLILAKAIEKCKIFIRNKTSYSWQQNHSSPDSSVNGRPGQPFKENFLVNYHNHLIPIRTSDIAFFMKDKLNYISLFNGEVYHSDYETLDEIEHVLNPDFFYRANRQFIIHINSIKSVELRENYKLKVNLKENLPHEGIEISKEKAPFFRKWLNR